MKIRHFFGITLSLLSLLACSPKDENAHTEGNKQPPPVYQSTPDNGQRIALVIGNSDYQEKPLKNPVNDAHAMTAKLRELGFDVLERTNLKQSEMGATLTEFKSKLSPGAMALVFYAGHGVQMDDGINYLPAVDATNTQNEFEIRRQSLSVKDLMATLESAKTRLNLVFIDACRDNPYSSGKRSSGSRGLARIEAPEGTLISYATKPGRVADDGDGNNGLYTSKLLEQMNSSLPIESVLKRVVKEVKKASGGEQTPWMEGYIEGEFCFAGCVDTAAAPAATSLAAVALAEKEQQRLAAIAQAKEVLKGEDLAQKKVAIQQLESLMPLDGEAMRYLGTNYELGTVVPENLPKACKWYRQAVQAQDTTAQNYLNDLKKEGKCKK